MIIMRTALIVAISIHAPLRERPWRTSSVANKLRFQSTLPCGSDNPPVVQICIQTADFNPRSLAGATEQVKADTIAHLQISIHAPSRERRYSLILVSRRYLIFQSTLPRGSDERRYPADVYDNSAFQSTLPRGSDEPFMASNIFATIFQSTLPRGSDENLLPATNF